ncbi:MAG: DUF3987 domain-containing protein [Verrucomicrobiota bacterium]
MSQDLLAKAKQRLPLPALMAQCGHGDRAKKSARCPFHEDSSASFSLYQRADGAWAWKCHAGCGGGDEVEWLAKHLKLSNGDACREFIKLAGGYDAPAPIATGPRNIVATYDYQDETGALLFQVVRFEPKTFRQRRPDATSPDGWTWKLGDTRRVLYRLPEIVAATQRGELIVLAEGEKDVAALVAHGFEATCNPAGAGKWLDDYTATLLGADVVIIADKDEPGRNHARLVAGKLHGQAKSIRIVELPDFIGQPVKDAADFFATGATGDDFQAAIAIAQPIAFTTAPAAPQKFVSKPAITLPEDDGPDDAPAAFPIECLPPAIALMVRAVATTQRVPDSLPGVMALALVAASIGKGLVLDWRPDKSPTPANLFAVVSALSGSGKSECSKQLASPFLEFERALQERWRKEVMPKLQADLRFHEGQLKKLDRKLAKDSTSAEDAERFRSEMVFHQAQVDELKLKLHEPQLSIQDATVEKVATVMHHNDETIFSTSSDARKLCDNLLGRYSANKKFADDGIYLNAYSGDDVKVDRQGRDGVRLANPCMTLNWALQPDALEALLDEESLQQGGWLARCLIAHTHAEPQYIGGDVRPISDEVRAGWENLIRSLLITYRQPPTLPATETMDEPL